MSGIAMDSPHPFLSFLSFLSYPPDSCFIHYLTVLGAKSVLWTKYHVVIIIMLPATAK